jgi:hypothetical protein
MRVSFALWLLALLLLPVSANAHKASDSYLNVDVQGNAVEVRWSIALRDIDLALNLDRDDNSSITWGELSSRQSELAAWAVARLSVKRGGDCRLGLDTLMIDHLTDGAYAVLQFHGQCPQPNGPLRLIYRLLFDLDTSHRGLLNLKLDGSTQTSIFDPLASEQSFGTVTAPWWRQLSSYVVEGVWHIWTGFDHLLFLTSLLLPSVLVRDAVRWVPAAPGTGVFWHVLAVVSGFTVAHSLTLSAAVLGWLALPSRWVESAIALSVVLAAGNNLKPVVEKKIWLFAFGFGLIHGFGFAGILIDLQLPESNLGLSLAGFNIGVELGQIVVIAAFLPLAYGLRKTGLYRDVLLPGGSWIIITVAVIWLIERVLNIKLVS